MGHFSMKITGHFWVQINSQGFISKLKARVVDTQNGEMLDIPSAAHRLRIRAERLTEIILRNQIPLTITKSRKALFLDFLVSLKALREVIAKDLDGTVHPTRAAKILRVNIRTIRALLNNGALTSYEVPDLKTGQRRRYVCASSMEAFAQTYITVVDLAAQSGRLPGVEAVIQLGRGQTPLPLDPRCNMIFRRSDVL